MHRITSLFVPKPLTKLHLPVPIPGIKFNLSAVSDLTHVKMLSHKDNYIQVYSNSWGPAELMGFVVGGPGQLARKNFKIQTTKVKLYLFLLRP